VRALAVFAGGFHLAVRAGGALRAGLFHPAVRAGVTVFAMVCLPPVHASLMSDHYHLGAHLRLRSGSHDERRKESYF
jgi:hypothetical protein